MKLLLDYQPFKVARRVYKQFDTKGTINDPLKSYAVCTDESGIFIKGKYNSEDPTISTPTRHAYNGIGVSNGNHIRLGTMVEVTDLDRGVYYLHNHKAYALQNIDQDEYEVSSEQVERDPSLLSIIYSIAHTRGMSHLNVTEVEPLDSTSETEFKLKINDSIIYVEGMQNRKGTIIDGYPFTETEFGTGVILETNNGLDLVQVEVDGDIQIIQQETKVPEPKVPEEIQAQENALVIKRNKDAEMEASWSTVVEVGKASARVEALYKELRPFLGVAVNHMNTKNIKKCTTNQFIRAISNEIVTVDKNKIKINSKLCKRKR